MMKNKFIIIIYVLLLYSANNVSAFVSSDGLKGDITPKFINDSLYIEYDLELNQRIAKYYKYEIDSLYFQLFIDKEIDTVWFRLTENNNSDSSSNFEYKWKGKITYPIKVTKIPHKFQLRYYSTSLIEQEKVVDSVTLKKSYYPDGVFGRRVNFSVGIYSRERFPQPVKNDDIGSSFILEDRFGRFGKNYNILLGYSINHAGNFTLYDYGKIQGELFPWGKDRLLPMFHSAIKYSRIKGENGSNKFVKKGIGFEAGIRFDSKFERFRYSYTTAVGGYHRFDLLFAFMSESNGAKIGTMFSLYRGEYVKMISVGIYMEGIDGDYLSYNNNHPFLIKGLAYVAWLPFLPIAYLMSLSARS